MRRLMLMAGIALLAVTLVPPGVAGAQQGGPIVLMGIDAEDGGPNGHGPIENYVDVVNSILREVTKPGAGILVIGGGKDPDDSVTLFWDEIAARTGEAVTYVNTAASIRTADFSPFKMLGVVSDVNQTPDGGLTQEEHDALSARKNDVASFINAGGGLLGFSSNFDPAEGAPPYDYMSVVGGFTIRTDLDYEDINPTADGQAIGVTDDLDVCCWHNTFTSHPGFLRVLATNAEAGEGSGEPAALGGESVFVGEPPPEGESSISVRTCPGYESAQGNHIVGTNGNDRLVGTPERDVICGLGGNDRLLGRFGNDLLIGGAGRDTLLGGHGNDRLLGQRGNDELRGMVGGDFHNGGAGTDRCRGGRGNDRFRRCEV